MVKADRSNDLVHATGFGGYGSWLSPGRRMRRVPRPSLALRLICEFQLSGRPQGVGIEGADLGDAADVERDHEPVAGDAARDDFGALRQGGNDVACRLGRPSLRLEKAVAHR